MLYLNQNDYGHIPYMHNTDNGGAAPERRNIGTSGCGLCCACMVVDQLTTESLSLEECVRFAQDSGANHIPGCNMNILGPVVAERFGLEYRMTTDSDEMLDWLHRGGKVIVNVRAPAEGPGIFTTTGHYMTLISANGREVCILDPNLKPGKFQKEEEAGIIRVDWPLMYCSAGLLHQEARSKTPYHMFRRK